MPSGAKKRKAAKKKQASTSYSAPPPSSSSSTHSQSGGDDLKHHDGRHGDGGDVEGMEKSEDSSSVRSFISEGKSNAPKSTGSSSSSSSSGSSSSDDESHVVEKKIVVVEDAPATVDLGEPLESFSVKVTQVVDDLVKPSDILSEGVTQVNGSGLIGEADNLVVETPSVEKVSSVEQVVHVIESVSIENGSSSHVTESKSEDEKVLVTEENDDNPGNRGCHVEGSEISQYSDSQPLVASAPRIVQTTSWKGCCGIFELFTGSNK